ncbi:DUF6118 family protein [Pseudorhizobium halotolerans]|uniref:DUF6118 family protein n=1 Tax=Pseudorhizobium halotolerans TaxID=1233081 RepID=UPI003CC7FE92
MSSSSRQTIAEDLAQIVQNLALVGEHLEELEKSPLLKNGPEHYARALERSGEGLVKAAPQQLERQAAPAETSPCTSQVHGSGVHRTGGVSGAAGGDPCGHRAHAVPAGIVAILGRAPCCSIVMGGTHWQAGMSLMAFDSPEAWKGGGSRSTHRGQQGRGRDLP